MKKLYTLALVALMGVAARSASAQVAEGTYVPNIVTTDINGNTFDLYSYLNQGYTVIIDISATWCGPCWNLHESGTMEDMWAQHGPAGMPGVDPTTTDDVIIVYLEGDASTTTAELHGSGSSTQGDWVTGSDYIFLDDNTEGYSDFFQICGFPNTFVICPNRTIKKEYCGYGGSPVNITAAGLYSQVGDCVEATVANDPALLYYTGKTQVCDDVEVKVMLQNMGTDPLTSATIDVTGGGTPLTYTWSGTLNQYEAEEVVVGTTTVSNATTNLQINITSADGNTSNNATVAEVSKAQVSGTNVISVEIVTDQYGTETVWGLRNSSGSVVMSGGGNGAYGPDLAAVGTTVQPVVQQTVPVDCYTFEIYDAYGDGICCQYGAGSYKVYDNHGNVYAQGGQFESSEITAANVAQTSSVGIESVNGISGMSIYPVPVTDVATLMISSNGAEMAYTITDVLGKEIASVDAMTLTSGVNHVSINTTDFANGVYFINVNDGSKVNTLKFTVSK